mmetsp:Transcript_36979/g.59231  ORF Transcript_36979/g.59231 Transcript_36979/m.59231 type:complete len:151 (+) Transcript_36979:62-514(+)
MNTSVDDSYRQRERQSSESSVSKASVAKTSWRINWRYTIFAIMIAFLILTIGGVGVYWQRQDQLASKKQLEVDEAKESSSLTMRRLQEYKLEQDTMKNELAEVLSANRKILSANEEFKKQAEQERTRAKRICDLIQTTAAECEQTVPSGH